MRASQKGRQTTEYAVLLAVIAPLLVAALALLSDRVAARLQFLTNLL
jgi:Flp pilus assembly pilin Flp